MNAPIQPAAFTTASAAKPAGPYTIATPTLIRRGLLAIGVSLLIFWGVAGSVLQGTKNGVQTIGRDTAPSVIAAQQIRASLADLDASAVNAALLRGDAAAAAWKEFETEQRVLSDYLVTAAQNITYGDDERIPIVEIAADLQTYADLIGQARTAIASTDSKLTVLPDETLSLLRRASAIMTQKLMPAAAALNAANETVLENTWEERKSAFVKNVLILALAAFAPLVLLVTMQVDLVRRTRRQINLGLAAATLLFAAGAVWIGTGLAQSGQHLRVAKEDAFDSVRALWKARATLYSANADESYFLLDPAQKPVYAASFAAKIQRIAGPRFLEPFHRAAYLATWNIDYRGANCRIDNLRNKILDGGYIGDELNNVTFDHECPEALNLAPLFADYVAIDQKIRALDAAGDQAGALALDLGEKPGESNYAFAKVNQELGLLIYINQMAFDENVAKAIADIAPLPYAAGSLALLAGLWAFLGLRPRLAEYRA